MILNQRLLNHFLMKWKHL